MERIEPTHKEVMEYLDCYWMSKNWHVGMCQCRSKCQFLDCYKKAKEHLTKTVYTEEEIKQGQEANAKAMLDIERALATFHGEEDEE